MERQEKKYQCIECKEYLPRGQYYYDSTNKWYKKRCKACYYSFTKRSGVWHHDPYWIRKCQICQRPKMVSQYPKTQAKTGYSKICSACASKGYYKGAPIPDMELIHCSNCQEVKPKIFFTKDKRNINGAGTYCKECFNKYAVERYKKRKI